MAFFSFVGLDLYHRETTLHWQQPKRFCKTPVMTSPGRSAAEPSKARRVGGVRGGRDIVTKGERRSRVVDVLEGMEGREGSQKAVCPQFPRF